MNKDDWKNSKDVRAARIEKNPAWSWSMDEREFMAPILAERKAKETERQAKIDQAEAQRVKELQAKNPYKYQLEQFDKNPNRDGLDNVKPFTGSPEEAAHLQRMKEGQRAGQRARLQGMSDAVDAANDPYVKLKNEEFEKRQAALEKQAREREAAMAEVAKEYLANKEIFASKYGKDAYNAARTLAKQYLEGQVRKAGGPQVNFAGDTFGGDDEPQQPSAPSAPSGIKGAIVEAGKVLGSLGGNTAASSSLGQQGAPVAPSAPAAGASRQAAEFNSWEVAKQLHNPNIPEGQKLAMQSSLAPWQKKMVQDSLESYRKLQDDFSAAKKAPLANDPSGGMAGFLSRGVDRLANAGKAIAGLVGQNVSMPGRDDGYKPSDFPPANPATSDDEWRKAHVDAVDAENRGMKVRMDNFGRDAINALTPSKSELPPIDPESFGGFDPEKDPAAVARRMLNAY